VYSRLNKAEIQRKENVMGYRIKQAREAKGLSQEELAERANVSRTTIWNLETNPVAQTNTKTLVKIANALGCSIGDIFFADDVQ
jgi:transcriptional regulator with XRE-family HTH domain